jgi:hypothetical protein
LGSTELSYGGGGGRGIHFGRMAITKLEKIMKDWDVTEATKIKIAETIIFPIVTWTMRKKEEKN